MLARMVMAYVALGSNLGRRKSAVAAALEHLDALPGCRVRRTAPFFETLPVEAPPGSGPFINTAAAVETTLPPLELLEALLHIERILGRDRHTIPGVAPLRNAPRAIDLDLLLYGDHILQSLPLDIPHPRMHEREFVLEPLAIIAPDIIHPTSGKTIYTLLTELRSLAVCAHLKEGV
jgi:2-amino-4-hydroxy-6-hydroxymethyldihydropteridine diphosphokinase